MNLPPELLATICSFLPKPDLKASRLVCRLFDQAAIPFLFNIVFIAANDADLEVSRLISERFGPYVKELIYDTRLFADLDQSEHESEVLRGVNGKVSYKDGALAPSAQELLTSYTEYRTQFEEQEVLIESGDILAYLCCAIMSMPRLGSISITDEWVRASSAASSRGWQIRVIDHRMLQDQRQENILLHPASPYDVGHGDLDETKKRAFSSIRMVIRSLSIINHRIDRLVINGSDIDRFIPIDVFRMVPRDMQQLTSVLQHLESLSLELCTYEGLADMDDYYKQGKVANALATAKNLRQLNIFLDEGHGARGVENPVSRLQAILGGCDYPKLVSLRLNCFDYTESELTSFLCRHSQTLRHLDLEDNAMLSGYWEDVLDHARQLLHLTTVTIDTLEGGFRAPYECLLWEDYEEIDPFFFRSGPNPLTLHALAAFLSSHPEAMF